MAEQPWNGDADPQVIGVLAPNPGPMTLDGTNTWILIDPGADAPVATVVDPGPDDEGHLRKVLQQVRDLGGTVGRTLLTHHHGDHTDAAERWQAWTGAPVRGAGRGAAFTDGEDLGLGGVQIRAVLTPGHTADSVSFHLPERGVLLTGDTVLGRGTSFVAAPDGDLASYLDSLETLRALDPVAVIAPGHGPVVRDPAGWLRYYATHRRERLDQVRAALREGAATAGDADEIVEAVVERVYAQVPREVWPAARVTVRAQLEYLGRHG